MSRSAPRAAQHAVVVALATLTLVLVGTGLAAPAKAAIDTRPQKPARKHAAKRQVKKRPNLGLRAVQIANRLTGIPYHWGGASPQAGFDCSGLVQYVYGKVGIRLPHYAAAQYGHGRRVSRGSLRAGDLVFFSALGHVGIYAGGGKFIHAPRRGTTVRWSRLSSHGSYYGATRLLAA
jgi:cell wall-associated NlpC family hydrolase